MSVVSSTEKTKAPSTRIFLIPQRFLSGSKNFPIHTQRIQIQFACPHAPMVSGFTQVPRAALQSNVFRACAKKSKIVAANMLRCCCCIAILVYCSVRDWTWKYPDPPYLYTYYLNRRGSIFFPHCWADLKMAGFAMEFVGCVWTEAVSGKKKLRIQKYQDACGRRLNHTFCPILLGKIEQENTSFHVDDRLKMQRCDQWSSQLEVCDNKRLQPGRKLCIDG